MMGTLLDFQVNRLGYQFRNVELLNEALTHSLDTTSTGNSSQTQKNRKYDRLQVMGNPVIKFLAIRHVIQNSNVNVGVGKLATEKDQLIYYAIQTKVGQWLLQPTSPGGSPYELIRVDSASKLNFDKPGAQIPYKMFVRALMGAVYLDAGGIAGKGIEMASKVFDRLWGSFLYGGGGFLQAKSLQACFPPPSKDIQTFWETKKINSEFIKNVEKSIGVTITPRNAHILAGALIQPTFYDEFVDQGIISRDQYLPDYERLEFLGDSVLELIVTELVWLEEDPDYTTTDGLHQKIKKRIESKGLTRVYHKLQLRNFVKMRDGGIAGWNKVDDIVESIVGAVFVDGGAHAAMQFIKAVCMDLKDED